MFKDRFGDFGEDADDCRDKGGGGGRGGACSTSLKKAATSGRESPENLGGAWSEPGHFTSVPLANFW